MYICTILNILFGCLNLLNLVVGFKLYKFSVAKGSSMEPLEPPLDLPLVYSEILRKEVENACVYH